MAAPGLTEEETRRISVLEPLVLDATASEEELQEYLTLKGKIDRSQLPRMENGVLYLTRNVVTPSQFEDLRKLGYDVRWVE